MSALTRQPRWLCFILLALSLAIAMVQAQAQTPGTIKLVVPYPPGGSVDSLARMLQVPLQVPLQEQLNATVIVDNRPGAGGRIAASQVKREPADGSVVLIAPNALTTVQSLVYAGKLDYSMADDFVPVAKLASYPFSLSVGASSKVRTAADVVTSIKSNAVPGNYGTSGAGGMAHFSGLAFGKAAGVEWTHIPYKGGAPLIADLIGGHVPFAVDTLIDHIEHMRAKKIHIVGIFSPRRSPLAPEIPTLAEQGIVGMPSVEGWFGAFVPAKTPKETVLRIEQAIARALADPQLKAKLNKMTIEVDYLPSAAFAKLQAAELQQWAPVIRESGFKPD